MIRIWIFALLIFNVKCQDFLDPSIDISNQELSTSLISASEDASSFSNHTIIRSKRASQEDFSSMVDNLSVSARLITAISLQNGLIDQSISADKALAELLNIGSVDLEQLEKFDKAKVDGFVKNLGDTAATVTATSSLDSVEKIIHLIAKWTEKYAELGDIKDKGPLNTYFTVIESLKSEKLNHVFLSSMTIPAKNSLSSLEEVKKIPVDTHQDHAEFDNHLSALRGLRKNLEALEPSLKDLTTLAQALGKFQTIAAEKFPMESPHRRFLDLLHEYTSPTNALTELTSKQMTEVDNSFSTVSAVTKDRDACSTEIAEMKSIFLDRRLSLRTFTSGFINGHSDLEKLAADVQDPTFNALVGGYDVKQLGLDTLKLLETELTAVDNSWEIDSRQIETVTTVVQLHAKFGELKRASATTSATLTSINACVGPRPTNLQGFYDDATVIFDSAASLAGKLGSIPELNEQLVADLAHMTALKDLIVISNNYAERGKQVPGIVKQLKDFQHTDLLINSLTKLIPVIEKITKKFGTEDLNVLLQEAANGRAAVEGFVDHAKTSEFIAFFTCAKDLKSQMNAVSNSISLINRSQKLKNDASSLQNLNSVATTIGDSMPAIKKLWAVPATIIANKNVSVELKDLGKESETFGQSVAAMDNVRKVLEKKAELEKFMKDCDSVETAIQNEQDAKKKSEWLDGWGDFEKTKKELTYLFADLESRRDKINIGSRNRRSTGGFSTYQSVFSQFTGLKSVNLEVEKRLKVLADLNQATLLTSLNSLGSLNLNFASSNGPLSQITGTLGKLDAIFRNAVAAGSATPSPAQTPPPQTTQPVPQVTPSQVVQMLITTTIASGYGGLAIGCMIGVPSVCCFIAIVGVGCWWHRKNKEKKKDVEVGKDSKPNPKPKDQESPAASPAPPPSVPAPATASTSNVATAQPATTPNAPAMSQEEDIDAKLLKAKSRRKELKIKMAPFEAHSEEAKRQRKVMKQIRKEEEQKKGAIMAVGLVKGIPTEHPDELKKREEKRKQMNLLISWTWTEENKFVYIFNAFRGISRIPDFIRDFLWDVRKYAEVPDSAKRADKTMKEQYFDWRATQPPVSKFVGTHVAGSRDPELLCIRDTACVRADDKNAPIPYHGNRLAYPLYGTAYICESPQDNNVKTFLNMLVSLEFPNVVMCCTLDESARYFPLTMEEGPLIIGNFEITMVEEAEDIHGCAQLRHLLIKDNDTQKEHRLKHYHFEKWARGKVYWDGEDPEHRDFIKTFIRIQNETQFTSNSTLIHSFRGTGRAGIFAGAQFAFQSLMDFRFTPFLDIILLQMRSSRYGLIENGKQLLMLGLISCQWIYEHVQHYSEPFVGIIGVQWDKLRDFSDMGEPETKDREEWARILAEAEARAQKTARDLSERDIDLNSPAVSEANLKPKNIKKKKDTLDGTLKSKSKKKSLKSKRSVTKSTKKSLKPKKSKVSVTKSTKKSLKSTKSVAKSTKKSVKSKKSKVSVTKSKSELKP